MAASYPSAAKSFTAINAGDTVTDTMWEDAYDEITAIEQALLNGLAHDLKFTDATYDIGKVGATRPRDGFFSRDLTVGRNLYVNDTSNANNTAGVTLNQGAADDEILALKSSDVAHGITGEAETDSYGTVKKASASNGGVAITGYSAGNQAVRLYANATTEDTTKSNAGVGYHVMDSALKSGATITGPSANTNLLAVRTGATTRFILDADGDSHQDVGTAWTNFDDRDDALTLTALSAAVSRPGDPVREAFVDLIEAHRPALEAAGLVTFNADGHHFVNWSRTNMLVIGAVRQLAQQLQALTEHLGLPPGHGVQLLPKA